jgi:hypothetical protein
MLRPPGRRRTERPRRSRGVALAVEVAEHDDGTLRMADEDLVWTEGVPIGAVRGRVGDPLPGRGLYQLAEHAQKHMARPRQAGFG